jgi:hypothetical protein
MIMFPPDTRLIPPGQTVPLAFHNPDGVGLRGSESGIMVEDAGESQQGRYAASALLPASRQS